ncbi:ABC transporter ATP-binding protein [Martelella mediterranea]|uniref:Maltose/maltodextrin import ATP-binding protein MalK n=1 Tax=Martelella mediterranea DSM 17316 TaxID=1122214 RepID=A0A1U9Z8G8_9HYPH|nr:sn-glycerol-3-phosphate ABC transporter ATP-binding protein UgpC [Martelella mediterranea]AQZ54009.1 Maltose/maltodextrin import ATP-binding protein MalK [Martelella mediterranea DSM 17316]
MAQLALRDIRKSYGSVDVIHGVSLEVEEGELVVFVGPSGCGKSTLLRMIAGLEDITGGELTIGGERMNDVEPADRGVAMVFQSYALYPHMTVADNMSFGLRMTRHPKAEIEEKVRHAADILQLTPLLERKPSQLSGGQRQRVAIGRAIVRNPEVFLFDEPLSNLDAELRVQTRVEIAKLHAALGNTMIYVTHDQTEAMTLADRIVVLRGGRVEQIGAPVSLYHDPDNLFVAGFIGSPRMNFLKAVANGDGTVSVAGGNVRLPDLQHPPAAGQEVTFGIRPEHLDAESGNELPITVDVSEELGATTYVYGTVEGGEPVIAERRNREAPRHGETITLRFDPAHARLFDRDGLRIR